MAAGDIKGKYATQRALTFTSLNSLAGSSSFLAGAGCLAEDNTSELAVDALITGKITWSSTAPAAGLYRMDLHAYSSLNDTPDYPVDGSGNALGTDLARTFAQDADKVNSTTWLKSLDLFATASKVYTFSSVGLAAKFGVQMLPKKWGVWVTHGVTTGSSTPASSGNTFWAMPVLAQYT